MFARSIHLKWKQAQKPVRRYSAVRQKKKMEKSKGYFLRCSIQSGDHFVAQLGCRDGDDDCDVRFELTIKIITPPNNITSQNTQGWHQVYDGSLTSVDIDLSGFAGKYLQFVFRVRANNNSDENRASLGKTTNYALIYIDL